MRAPLEERFWAKVSKPADTTCWPWTGTKTAGGYGVIRDSGKRMYAHRVSFDLNLGEIPAGAVIDHKCHNPGCVRPGHLQAVTQKQNCENLGVLRCDNQTGVRGIGFDRRKGKYRARVHHFKKEIFVGYFSTVEEAEVAVVAKRNELFTNNLADRVSP
ncbi:endonuclease [Arthrobacter phage Persistence]|uniref:HNH endonuclease n=1 Tax=Arthrobacter phage Persistence TaxID=2836007 RepID=A0A8F3E481_9CAUD|nr:endonuclease [Arthrobacter phage Persistence]QWY79695.1 HNH endonuclease [Arthrobacter phage Persistence]